MQWELVGKVSTKDKVTTQPRLDMALLEYIKRHLKVFFRGMGRRESGDSLGKVGSAWRLFTWVSESGGIHLCWVQFSAGKSPRWRVVNTGIPADTTGALGATWWRQWTTIMLLKDSVFESLNMYNRYKYDTVQILSTQCFKRCLTQHLPKPFIMNHIWDPWRENWNVQDKHKVSEDPSAVIQCKALSTSNGSCQALAQNQTILRKKISSNVFPDNLSPIEHEMFHCNEFLLVGQATEDHCTSTVAKDLLSATCKTHIEATCGQKLTPPGLFISCYFILCWDGCLKDSKYQSKRNIFFVNPNMSNSGAFIVGGFPECEYLLNIPVRFKPTHHKNNTSIYTCFCWVYSIQMGSAPERKSKLGQSAVSTKWQLTIKGGCFNALPKRIKSFHCCYDWDTCDQRPFPEDVHPSQNTSLSAVLLRMHPVGIHVAFVLHHLLFTLFSSHWNLIIQHSSFNP